MSLRHARARALAACLETSGPALISVSLMGLSQKTAPKEVFVELALKFEINQSIESREALSQKLLDAGYLKSDPCEDPGTFCVRGEIIDIFAPHRANPIRIELFDDLI